MIRTGIFGGSFNPIHNGHINLAHYLLQEEKVEEIWLMVSPHNPLKDSNNLLDEHLRLEMASKALRKYEKIAACDFEFHLPRPTYTWRTLCELKKAYPNREFILIIGADNWHVFHKWAHYEDILHHHSILIYPREGYTIENKELPHGVEYVNAPLFPWSSTEIRQLWNEGGDISPMVPPEIVSILKERKMREE